MEIIGSGQHDHIDLRISQGTFNVSKGFDAKAMPNLSPGLGSTANDPVKTETRCQGEQRDMKVATGIPITDHDHIGGVHVVSLIASVVRLKTVSWRCGAET
jgi:hypothetical protein